MFLGIGAGVLFLALLAVLYCTVTHIPNDKVGIVEKLWSNKGSLKEGEIIALNGEAGYQADILRGGLHFGYWSWQYSIHKVPLIVVRQNKIGYIFSRTGKPLEPSQTLGKVVECNNFQDARSFLSNSGQKGRQRAILREGVYAINTAVFSVILEDKVVSIERTRDLEQWKAELANVQGFTPIIISGPEDKIGIVTVHDGPALPQGEIIAPAVGCEANDPNNHNNFQDTEKFLSAGGKRGVQYAVLIDGTYFINRWFATVQMIQKTTVDIGNVGVVVSYYGKEGQDTSGTEFRHGERVHTGERGVWEKALGPGKYPFNTQAGKIVTVPTTNFVLHWITGKSEGHKFDDSLCSIELITKDAYEPVLPLSVVVHIDYQRAPGVIQRFGDVKKLITQTIDPMLSAYFRDVAHRKSMLELIHDRDDIQQEAREALKKRFTEFDIECVDVLIGRPESKEGDNKIEALLEQLRQRQFAIEQVQTYQRQKEAAAEQQSLNEAQAKALKQSDLTNSQIQIEIEQNAAAAQLARSKKDAEKMVVMAEAAAKQQRLEGEGVAAKEVAIGKGKGEAEAAIGEGRGKAVSAVGLAEANVLEKKVASYGDPKYYALTLLAESIRQCQQPLVPSTVIGGSENTGAGVLTTLMNLVALEKVDGVLKGKKGKVQAQAVAAESGNGEE